MQSTGIFADIQKMHDATVPSFVSPRSVVSELNLWQGDHVCDFAAGAGHFVPHLRAAVGSNGKVYARNEQPAHHEMLMREHVMRGQHEVVPHLHTLDDGELDIVAGIVDAVLLVSVLSRETSRVTKLLAEVERVIRRGGKLCVVDWRTQRESERALLELLASFGFTPKRALTPRAVGVYHYGIIFTKQ